MLRPVLCLLLVAFCTVAVHPPIVAACCLAVDRSGCCGPSNECCRVVQARDAAAGPTERLYDPGSGPGQISPPAPSGPAFVGIDLPAFGGLLDDRPPPDSAGVRIHLALAILRV